MLSTNILRGAAIRLTALAKEDIPTLVRWYEDAGYLRLLDALPAAPRSESQLASWLEKQEEEKNAFMFAIRPLDGQKLLGFVGLDGIVWNNQSGWLSIGLGDRADWRKGYGREAMELALNFAFQELNLYRVQLTVFSYNEPAIALYEKSGFTREGVFREHLWRDGKRHDMILYGLLRREWTGGRDTSPH